MINNNSAIKQKFNLICSDVMYLIFAILTTLSLVYSVVFEFSAFNIVSYIISILMCVSVWLIFAGAKSGSTSTAGFSIINGIMHMYMILLALLMAGCVLLSFVILLKADVLTGIILMVVFVCFFMLIMMYYDRIAKMAVSGRDIVKTGNGQLQISMYVIVIMFISAVGEVISLAATSLIYEMADSLLSEISSQMPYGMGSSSFDMVQGAMGGDTMMVGPVLSCLTSVMTVVLLIRARSQCSSINMTDPSLINNNININIGGNISGVNGVAGNFNAAPDTASNNTNNNVVCSGCGNVVIAGAKFCNKCGKQLGETAQSQPQMQTAQSQEAQYNQSQQQEQYAWSQPQEQYAQPQQQMYTAAAETNILSNDNYSNAGETSVLSNSNYQGMFVGVAGSIGGKSFYLQPGYPVAVGRDASQCGIVIDESSTSVSRKHCVVEYVSSSDSYIVTDYSANGVFVNNTRITKGQPQSVQRGSEIKLGDGFEVFCLD